MADAPRAQADVHIRAVLIGASAIAAAVMISLLVAYGLLRGFGHPAPAIAGRPFQQTAGPPLERYRVVDRQAGVGQIPIERAMALLAAEHGESAPSRKTQ